MSLLKRKEYHAIKMIEQIFLAAIFIFPFRVHAQNDSKAFGDSIFITNGLTGKIYLLPAYTRVLPGFDTMKSVGTVYTDSINIPPRSWSSGFPGLRDRFEWFGIEYTGFFKANKEGEYVFRLLSDDGSKLFIDDSLIINNDGLHGAFAKTGKITLDDSRHSIKIQYFQGPRYQIALQLFASVNNSKEEIFPGNNFILYTQSPHDNKLYYFLILCGLILLIILFIIVRHKKKKKRGLEER
jgi:preprotein translocase subunit YajC